MDLREYKKIIDKLLSNFIYNKIQQAKKMKLTKNVIKQNEYLYDLIMQGGKRIRPYLIYIIYKAFGGKIDNEIINFSMGFELFHNFALIHDDIMDKGKLRHGIKTAHEKYSGMYKVKESYDIGVSQAILIGDLLFNRSNEIIYGKYNINQLYLEQARNNFNLMVNEVIRGQMIDIDLKGIEKTSKENLLLKNHLKTSSYSFIRPMQTGGLLSGAAKITYKQLENIGIQLGNAYQIKDDLSDITGNNKDKTNYSDIQEGQKTFISQYINDNSTEKDKKIFNGYLGHKLDKIKIKKITEIIEKSGAINYGKNLINESLSKAKNEIENLNFIEKSYKNNILEIVETIRI